jgi:hypothetical protein
MSSIHFQLLDNIPTEETLSVSKEDAWMNHRFSEKHLILIYTEKELEKMLLDMVKYISVGVASKYIRLLGICADDTDSKHSKNLLNKYFVSWKGNSC